MYIDEDFMVYVYVYLFFLFLDFVFCFIFIIVENLINFVFIVNMWEKWKIEDFMRYKILWNISFVLGFYYFVFLYNIFYGIR